MRVGAVAPPLAAEPVGMWLGQLVADEFLPTDPAASLAGNLWQSGLLEALCDQGKRLAVYGGTPHSAWPRSRLVAPDHAASLCGGKLDARMTGYLNLPLVKLFRQHALLRRLIGERIGRSGRPAVAFTYNAGYPEAATGRWLQEEHGVPWVSVLADYPESTDPRVSWARRTALDVYGGYQRKWVGQAAGRVYLSWALFEEERNGPKFHLDGGIAAIRASARPRPAGERRVLLFAGSLNALTGVDLLLDAFRRVEDRACELWICGRGNLEPQVAEAAGRDSRIKFLGLLSPQEFAEVMARADFFANPRPSALPENRSNFPSKVLEYLSWCRPVISTMTPGISPAYREVLTPIREETAEGLAEVIEETLSLSHADLAAQSEKIRAYVEQNLLWSIQARRLWRWLETENLLARN